MATNNQSGSTLIESIIGLKIVIIVLTLTSFVFTLSLVKVWAHFVIYESLICLAEAESENICRAKALTQLKTILPFSIKQQIKLLKMDKQRLRGELTLYHQEGRLQSTNFKKIFEYKLEITSPEQYYRGRIK